MLVDLVCIKECFVDMDSTGRCRYVSAGQHIDEFEVNGDELWLKFFNAYEPSKPIAEPKAAKQILIEDIGCADKEAEKVADEPTPQDLGAGPAPSIKQIESALSIEQMVNMLKSDGLKVASDKWKSETLAKHIEKRQLYTGKL